MTTVLLISATIWKPSTATTHPFGSTQQHLPNMIWTYIWQSMICRPTFHNARHYGRGDTRTATLSLTISRPMPSSMLRSTTLPTNIILTRPTFSLLPHARPSTMDECQLHGICSAFFTDTTAHRPCANVSLTPTNTGRPRSLIPSRGTPSNLP